MEKTAALQQAARGAGILVCYCATVFRPGYVEIGDRNKTFSQRKASGQPAVFDALAVIHPAVRPIEGEVVVGKHRVNALYGTGLDVVLRANDIRNSGHPGLRHQRGGAFDRSLRVGPRLQSLRSGRLLLRLRPGGPRLPHREDLPAAGRGGTVGGRDCRFGRVTGILSPGSGHIAAKLLRTSLDAVTR